MTLDSELTPYADEEAVKIINAYVKGKITQIQAHEFAEEIDEIERSYRDGEIDLEESIKQIKEVYK